MINDYDLYEMGKFRSKDLIKEAEMASLAEKFAQKNRGGRKRAMRGLFTNVSNFFGRRRKLKKKSRFIHSRKHSHA